MREKADAFVGVDGHGSIRSEPVSLQAQLRSLLVSQMFFWVGLIELDGGTINLGAKDRVMNRIWDGLHFRKQKNCLDTRMALLHF